MSTVRDHFSTTRAKDVMTRNVVTVFANQTMGKAAEMLRVHRITGVPVVTKEGICLGVLSTKDFPEGSQGDFDGGHVISHMTSPAITVSENHSLLDVAAILWSSHIHRVPVVDERGHVVGILSTLDICDQILRAIEVETETAHC